MMTLKRTNPPYPAAGSESASIEQEWTVCSMHSEMGPALSQDQVGRTPSPASPPVSGNVAGISPRADARVLFVGDGGNTEIFRGVLNEREVDLEAQVRPALLNLSLLRRHLTYARLAAYAVVHRREYDLIFVWQQYIGLYYYMFSIAYPLYPRPCCVYYILYKAQPGSVAGVIKRFLMASMINSKAVGKSVFLSRSDGLYSQVCDEKKVVLSTYTEKSSFIESRLLSKSINVCSDYFAGGASNRDYSVLVRLAEGMQNKRFSVACLPKELDRMSPIPQNMHVECAAYGNAFEELILSAKAVLIPIKDRNVVSGQIVCLRAMQAGKPVFMTKNTFMSEWMPDSTNLPFFVTYDDVEELIGILGCLTDKDLSDLGQQARAYYLRQFDELAFYGGLANIIEAQLRQ